MGYFFGGDKMLFYKLVLGFQGQTKNTWIAMSNLRSFKIGSFRFVAFVPKKIEYNSFWNKILDWNKTFSNSSSKFWSKRFRSGLFPNLFEKTKSFVLSLKNTSTIWNVLVWFRYHFLKIQTFCFDSWAA